MGRVQPGREIKFFWARDSGALYRVTANISPFDPGQLTGPYEDSYPAEGGDVEDIKLVRIHAVTGEEFPVTKVTFDDLTTKEQKDIEQQASDQGADSACEDAGRDEGDMLDGDR